MNDILEEFPKILVKTILRNSRKNLWHILETAMKELIEIYLQKFLMESLEYFLPHSIIEKIKVTRGMIIRLKARTNSSRNA